MLLRILVFAAAFLAGCGGATKAVAPPNRVEAKGHVASANGSSFGGVTITLAGAAKLTMVTDSTGAYDFTSLPDGAYTVTPSLSGYTFNPASASFTAVSNGFATTFTSDFRALNTMQGISGSITGIFSNGTVWITATGTAIIKSVPVSGPVDYAIGDLPDGVYDVSLSGAGYLFTPPSASVTLAGTDVTGINFTVTPVVSPAIATDRRSLTFNAQAGAANPAAQTIAISNTGGGTLSGLAVGSVAYGPGGTGWLTASLSGTTAPAVLTLTATTGTLFPGSYTATLPVTSGVAGNSPQTVTVTIVVAPAPTPGLLLSPVPLTVSAVPGGPTPANQSVTVVDAAGGAIPGVRVTGATWGSGATSWVFTNSQGACTTPCSISLGFSVGKLPNGVYSAQFAISGSGVPTVQLPITLTVAGSTLHLSAASIQPNPRQGSAVITSQTGLAPAMNCQLLAGTAGATGCDNTYAPGTVIDLNASVTLASVLGPWGGACAAYTNSAHCAVIAATPDVYVSKLITRKPLVTRPILFDSNSPPLPGQPQDVLFSELADGTGLTQLTSETAPPGGFNKSEFAAWSPDGTTIVYHRLLLNSNELYLMNADGSNKHALTQFGTPVMAPNPVTPQWSRDGTKIAFSVGGSGGQVAVIGANGAGYAVLSPSANFEWAPSWTADGRIMFTTNHGGSGWYIDVMLPDGSGRTTLASNPNGTSYPKMSHDGKSIAYVESATGTLIVMNADGSNPSRVFTTTGLIGPLGWSADDLRIAFTVDIGGVGSITYVDRDGFNVTSLPNVTGGGEFFNDW